MPACGARTLLRGCCSAPATSRKGRSPLAVQAACHTSILVGCARRSRSCSHVNRQGAGVNTPHNDRGSLCPEGFKCGGPPVHRRQQGQHTNSAARARRRACGAQLRQAAASSVRAPGAGERPLGPHNGAGRAQGGRGGLGARCSQVRASTKNSLAGPPAAASRHLATPHQPLTRDQQAQEQQHARPHKEPRSTLLFGPRHRELGAGVLWNLELRSSGAPRRPQAPAAAMHARRTAWRMVDVATAHAGPSGCPAAWHNRQNCYR